MPKKGLAAGNAPRGCRADRLRRDLQAEARLTRSAGAQGSRATQRAGRRHAPGVFYADAQPNVAITLAPVLGRQRRIRSARFVSNSQSRCVVCRIRAHRRSRTLSGAAASARHGGTRRKRGPHAVGLGLAVPGQRRVPARVGFDSARCSFAPVVHGFNHVPPVAPVSVVVLAVRAALRSALPSVERAVDPVNPRSIGH